MQQEVTERKLTLKQRLFVDHYLTCWNATKAAKLAGYSKKTAGSQGHRLLKKAEIQSFIKIRMEEIKMGANEVLLRLADHARASMGDLVTIDSSGEPIIDLSTAKEDGKLHLINKITYDKDGNLRSISLHDSQTALVHLGRVHGLFLDRSDLTSDGSPITFKVIYDED